MLDFRCYGYAIQSTDCNVDVVNNKLKTKLTIPCSGGLLSYEKLVSGGQSV